MASDRHIAVVGSGIAGLTAAHICVLAGARVTLFEADSRLGGHADTHVVAEGDRVLTIDTGFIVHNRRTYPTLLRLFRDLGVTTQDSEMSMSMADDGEGLTWLGGRGLQGLFPTGRHLRDPQHLRMLAAVPRFHRAARRLLAEPAGTATADMTLAEFLRRGGFSPYFVRHFVEPVVAAVWSCDPTVAGQYPARYLFEFLDHHGLLSLAGGPVWRTVTGGSREYVQRIGAEVAEVHLSTAVVAIREDGDEVEVTDEHGRRRRFDQAVIAVHPHQALAMLADSTAAQREVLGALEYVPNTAVLHTDVSLLPSLPAAWGSWNFRRRRDEAGPVTMTYDLTRLQRLSTTTRYLVTLGAEEVIDPSQVIATMQYEHPLYTPTSVAAQRRLPEIDTDRLAFAGAYHGWGFHEDGARSGLAAAQRLGFSWAAADDTKPEAMTSTTSPALYATGIVHLRRSPWQRSFHHRSQYWVVDLDALPEYRASWRRLSATVFGTVEARDHLGDPEASLRDNVAGFLRRHDIELGSGRVLLATHPRALGFCFNPISVFWCTSAAGELLATVVEVHNTYGDRHAYLIRPDDGPVARVPKEMYVSPFHGTDGYYRISAPVPTDRLDIVVSLHTDDGALFSASLRGERVRRGRVTAALAGLRDAALIRVHGIALWARRLPIHPRPVHHQEGV